MIHIYFLFVRYSSLHSEVSSCRRGQSLCSQKSSVQVCVSLGAGVWQAVYIRSHPLVCRRRPKHISARRPPSRHQCVPVTGHSTPLTPCTPPSGASRTQSRWLASPLVSAACWIRSLASRQSIARPVGGNREARRSSTRRSRGGGAKRRTPRNTIRPCEACRRSPGQTLQFGRRIAPGMSDC